MATDARCDHDKDKAATGAGSWTVAHDKGRIKIVCRYCGRFYGYVVTTKRGTAMVEAKGD